MRYLPFMLAAMTAATPTAAQVRVAMGEEVHFPLETPQAAPARAPATPTPYETAVAQEFARRLCRCDGRVGPAATLP